MGAARFRINEDKMADLRVLVLAGWPQRRIAAVLGVCQATISETISALRIPQRRRNAARPKRRRNDPPQSGGL
jgi:predicted transcriptional regulator